MFGGTSANQVKKDEFVMMLEKHNLGHCFTALKGGSEAIQLQHVMKLKKIAMTGGETALAKALGDVAGIKNDDDQVKLAALLYKKLTEDGGIPFMQKPLPPSEAIVAKNSSDAWKAGLSSHLTTEVNSQKNEVSLKDKAICKDDKTTTIVDEAGDTWPAGMKIMNGHLAKSIRAQKMLHDGNGYGYIHLAAEIEIPSLIGIGHSKKKKEVLNELKVACRSLRDSYPIQVQRADVFDAFIIPPGSKEGREVLEKGGYDVHIAEFDVVVLIECTNPEFALEIRQSAEFLNLKLIVDNVARFVHCIVGENPKQIGNVNKDKMVSFYLTTFMRLTSKQKVRMVLKYYKVYGNIPRVGGQPMPT